MITPRRTEEDGFTLIEVLVAFAVLAGAIVLTFQIYASGFRRMSMTDRSASLAAEARTMSAELAAEEFISVGQFQREGSDGRVWNIQVETVVEGDSEAAAHIPIRVRLSLEDNSSDSGEPLIDTVIIGQPVPP